MTVEDLAAVIAAGLVQNDRYMRCTKRGNYSALDGLGERSTYAIDAEAVARDAFAVAKAIAVVSQDDNRSRR